MICAPITCNGTDLAAVCADIRLRGGCIEAMDVIGRAKYRVSYFYRVAEESQSARVRDPDTGHAGPVSVPNFERESRPEQADDSPVLSTGALANRQTNGSVPALHKSNVENMTPKYAQNVAAGDGKRAEKPKSAQDAPASILERGDRTIESNDSTKDKQQASENHFGKVATVRGLLLSDAGSARNAMTRKPSSVCAEPAALYSSIEDRMAAMQSKLLASGKIKRSKPKTMPDNYRSPYAD